MLGSNQILDGIVIALESDPHYKVGNSSGILIKLDISGAFDKLI